MLSGVVPSDSGCQATSPSQQTQQAPSSDHTLFKFQVWMERLDFKLGARFLRLNVVSCASPPPQQPPAQHQVMKELGTGRSRGFGFVSCFVTNWGPPAPTNHSTSHMHMSCILNISKSSCLSIYLPICPCICLITYLFFLSFFLSIYPSI